MNTGFPCHLMIAFLPSGMLASSTPAFVRASPSANTDMVPRNSIMDDLATNAESTPMDLIMKYESVQLNEVEDTWYVLRLGTPGTSRRGMEICMVCCWKKTPVVGAVAKDLLTKLLEESWYPLAHLESMSQWLAWCASWACAERLREGALGMPDASGHTVGESHIFFLLPEQETVAI